jgi:hypothetical protein
MTFTISADDPRTIRAIEIAADADQWLRYSDGAGNEAYRVPSQAEAGRFYLVTPSSCDCADFRRNELPAVQDGAMELRPCKHMLAVRLYRELVKAQANHPRASTTRRRGLLSLVPRSDQPGASPSPSAS